MEERIEGLRESVAAVSQRLVAPKTWLGAEEVNVLQVLCDLLDIVHKMNLQLATHTHQPGPTPNPSDTTSLLSMASTTSMLGTKLKKITSLAP